MPKRIKKITGALKKILEGAAAGQAEESLYKELLDVAFDCRVSIYESKESFFIHVIAARSSLDLGWPGAIDKMYIGFSNFLTQIQEKGAFPSDPYIQIKAAEGLILLKPKHYFGYVQKIAALISTQKYEPVPGLLQKLRECDEIKAKSKQALLAMHGISENYYFRCGKNKLSLSIEASNFEALNLKIDTIALFEQVLKEGEWIIENLENKINLIDEVKFHILKSHYIIASILSSEDLLLEDTSSLSKKAKKSKLEAQHLNAAHHYKCTIEAANELLALLESINDTDMTEKYRYYKISALKNKAHACTYLNLNDEAFRCFDKIEAINPGDYNNQLNKSAAQSKRGDYKEALESAKKAMMFLREHIANEQHSIEHLKSLEHKKYLLHIHIGKTFEHLMNWEEALSSYEQALEYGEDNSVTSCAIGLLHSKTGNKAFAKELMTQILSQDSELDNNNLYEVIISLADLHYNDNSFIDAVIFYQRALKIRDLDEYKTCEAQIKLGHALYGLGNYDEALEILRQIPAAEAQQKAADILLKQGSYKEALAILKSIPFTEEVIRRIKDVANLIAQKSGEVTLNEESLLSSMTVLQEDQKEIEELSSNEVIKSSEQSLLQRELEEFIATDAEPATELLHQDKIHKKQPKLKKYDLLKSQRNSAAEKSRQLRLEKDIQEPQRKDIYKSCESEPSETPELNQSSENDGLLSDVSIESVTASCMETASTESSPDIPGTPVKQSLKCLKATADEFVLTSEARSLCSSSSLALSGSATEFIPASHQQKARSTSPSHVTSKPNIPPQKNTYNFNIVKLNELAHKAEELEKQPYSKSNTQKLNRLKDCLSVEMKQIKEYDSVFYDLLLAAAVRISLKDHHYTLLKWLYPNDFNECISHLKFNSFKSVAGIACESFEEAIKNLKVVTPHKTPVDVDTIGSVDFYDNPPG